MTEGAFDTSAMALPEDNSPIVAWLASEEAGDVTGRVIEIEGGKISVENGWAHGPARDIGRRWDAAEVGPALRELLAEAPAPEPVYGALSRAPRASPGDGATGGGRPAGLVVALLRRSAAAARMQASEPATTASTGPGRQRRGWRPTAEPPQLGSTRRPSTGWPTSAGVPGRTCFLVARAGPVVRRVVLERRRPRTPRRRSSRSPSR